MEQVNVIVTLNTVTVNYDGETHTVDKSRPEYRKVIDALKEGRKDDIPDIINASKAISSFSDGKFSVKNGLVYVGEQTEDNRVPDVLARRILAFAQEDLPVEPLIKFFNNLKLNTSFRSRQGLYEFLEHNGHPITDDGTFIAYKGVTSEYQDCHTRTLDNSIGALVKIARHEVDEDPNRTCSHGLHVASYDYAHNNYGSGSAGVTVEVEVNPRDVVAVPYDYSAQKMRVCEYKVLGVSKGQIDKEYLDRDDYYQPLYDGDPYEKGVEDWEDDDLDEDDDLEDELESERFDDDGCPNCRY